MRDFLFSLFEVSLTTGAVIALLLALSPVWKRRFRPQWRCWAWLLVALRLAVPLNVSLPQAPVTLEAPAPTELSAAWVDEGTEGFRGVEFAAHPASAGAADTALETAADTPRFSLTLAELVFGVWLAGAAGVLAVQLVRYAAFRRHTRRWSSPAGEYEGIPVYGCALLSAPALVGLFRPRILLPEGLTEEQRTYALAHEAVHARRHDLWYKALLLWARAVHWFNPLVWLLGRAAERDVEICCDAAALAGKDEGWRRGYGAALLSFVSARPAAPLTSQFAGGVRGLKERFRALVSAAPARRGRLALVLVLCAALLGGSLVACRQQEIPEETTPPTGTPLGEVIDPADLADGTYWATLPLSDWVKAEPVTELALTLVEVDPDTMTITGGEPYQGDGVVLPLAEDVALGNHGERGIKDFLMWSLASSHIPVVLEVEVTGGQITAMTWHDAVTEPAAAVEVSAVVHEVDPEAGTLTYALDNGNVGADSEWIEARVSAYSSVDLAVLAERVLPLSSWGLPCTLYLEDETTVAGIKAGALADGVYYTGSAWSGTEDWSQFTARPYGVDPDTLQVTQAYQDVELTLWRDAALYNEDGTAYEGSAGQFMEEFQSDADQLRRARRRYNTVPAVNLLSLRVTIGGGLVTSMTRLPAPDPSQPAAAVSLE